ncbi:hypothetical protein F4780DRAFT_748087 [Xylariomycetidae sp. FL0641]|nr:hypothetical protein F4780DRAFT_748087 [Xylariomycetidae sp. FL0641]
MSFFPSGPFYSGASPNFQVSSNRDFSTKSMSSSGDWGSAPPGIDLTENQDANIVASVVVITVIGLAAVALRLFARLSRQGPGLAEDDYVILVASVCAHGPWEKIQTDDRSRRWESGPPFAA